MRCWLAASLPDQIRSYTRQSISRDERLAAHAMQVAQDTHAARRRDAGDAGDDTGDVGSTAATDWRAHHIKLTFRQVVIVSDAPMA